jgi:hypothetical protein
LATRHINGLLINVLWTLRSLIVDNKGMGLQLAFDAEHEAVLQAEARRGRLDKAIEVMAANSEFTPVVHRLGACAGSRR